MTSAPLLIQTSAPSGPYSAPEHRQIAYSMPYDASARNHLIIPSHFALKTLVYSMTSNAPGRIEDHQMTTIRAIFPLQVDHFDLFLFGFWGNRARDLASCDLRLGPGGIEVVAWQAAILFLGSGGIEIVAWQATTSVWVLGALRSWPGNLRPPFGFWGH
ncbi:hypothetical protein B0H14DRAFT_3130461 [Mycena olivaceomarginata]|nr:hypothetical protein B0H14DRAFT_3130461 [Mycena olivaceomarginata]